MRFHTYILVPRYLLENVGGFTELPETRTNGRVASNNVPMVYPQTVITFLLSTWFAYLRSLYFRSKVFDGYRLRRGWVINRANFNSLPLIRNPQTCWSA